MSEDARRKAEEARRIAEQARVEVEQARRDLSDLIEAVREQRQIFDEMLASARRPELGTAAKGHSRGARRRRR